MSVKPIAFYLKNTICEEGDKLIRIYNTILIKLAHGVVENLYGNISIASLEDSCLAITILSIIIINNQG